MRKIMIGLAPTLLAMSTGALAQTPGWKVSEVSGDVRLVENGRARAAVRGALLSSGATIATGANAKAVIVRGQEFVVISPRSQLRVPAADAPNKIMQLIEDFGTAVFKINKKSTPHFGVQTPYLAAVVKGTTFTVTVGPKGGSVQVTEGAVEVSTLDGGAKDLVRPGGIAQVGASDLYRLSVQGETNKVVRSENGKAPGAAKPQQVAYAGPSPRAAEVRARVGEGHKSLSDATGGLVEGSSGMGSAHANVKDLERGRGATATAMATATETVAARTSLGRARTSPARTRKSQARTRKSPRTSPRRTRKSRVRTRRSPARTMKSQARTRKSPARTRTSLLSPRPRRTLIRAIPTTAMDRPLIPATAMAPSPLSLAPSRPIPGTATARLP